MVKDAMGDADRSDDRVADSAPSRGAYVVLLFLSLLYCVNYAHRQIISMFMESIKRDLNLSDTQVGLVSGLAFTVIYSAASLPIAALAGRRSRGMIIAVCTLIWSISLGLTALVGGFMMLVVARMGVGVGESGFGPTATSLLTKYFPPSRMGRAAAIYGAGSCAGIFVSYGTGGWLLHDYGWRTGLILAAIPGVVLGLVALIFLRDDRRPATDAARPDVLPLHHGLAALVRRPTVRWVVAGAVLLGICDSSIFFWFAPFMMRIYAIPAETLGWMLGTGIGLSQLAGVLFAGFALDRLERRDVRWHVWLPAITSMSAAPAAAAVYLGHSAAATTILIAVPNFLTACYYAPTIATLQRVTPTSLFPLGVALTYACLTLFGYGLGPLIVGALSDRLQPTLGVDSLRYAMLITVPVYVAAGLCYAAAARTIKRDAVTTS
jgi:MFS family permease